jgi:hypothetical protein
MEDYNIMDKEKLVKLFKATASADGEGRIAAFKDFAAALTIPILQKLELDSIMRGLFAVERLGPGAQASYPIDDDLYDIPVWLLPGLGYVAQNFIEGVGEEVYVPTFDLAASADWKVKYALEGRTDVLQKAIAKTVKTLAEYEDDCGWNVIVPSVTSAWVAQGLLSGRPAPLYEVAPASPGAGYLSKELINKMIVGMERVGRKLTDLYISPEDAADIREWSDTDIDPVTRREIFQAAGMTGIWGVRMIPVRHLGATGEYNINSNDSEFGKFQVDGSDAYYDYGVDHPNKVNSDGHVLTLGETQIYGFDLSVNDSLVMPIKKEYEAIDDPTLLRRQKLGFFGWQEIGMACLDPRMMCMGIIDRAL